MWNPFKKAKQSVSNTAMGMMAKIAEKKIKNMSPKEREKMAREAFDPKNKDKLLSAMEMMRKSGQITEEQYREAKKRLGM
ncbi:MAG: hypothetical protein A2288_03360 [Candidatus Moranbacteria bacterium RIFOXYA12_FULL_44_15]|nr:MAG: hypothetical protein A2288_03360 [Candidatus Moranbacteria bacterium RIFOXYA12_FULL_44_15]OGI34939.1 MAG: hypothetical protein A2259_03710 [Candidatus Moranbacteria bacterium RIFOXYA2_FULL_43_15]